MIRLSAVAEHQIHACTRRFGTILENVVFDPRTRKLDLNDDKFTENTRGAYPLSYIDNAVDSKRGGHPTNVVLLTCDASGVLPPISRLTPDQAVYHFMSGYTSKIAGTEIGLGIEPVITFSACFGAPFMVHHPYKYAQMLKARILKHRSKVWMVNTGWTGGAFGIGERISIRHTRALLDAALTGKLDNVEFTPDPVFGVEVPKFLRRHSIPPSSTQQLLDQPRGVHQRVRSLAARFIENFEPVRLGDLRPLHRSPRPQTEVIPLESVHPLAPALPGAG